MNIKPHNIFVLFMLLFIKPYLVEAQAESISPKETKLLIDSLSNALNRWYIYPDKAALMISNVKKNYKSGVYNALKNKAAVGMQLHKDIQQAWKDGHLNVSYSPQLAGSIENPMGQQSREMDLKNARENNFAFKNTDILPGNIGYIRWDGFFEFIKEAKPTLDASFQFVSNCKALIIDMRYNGGGSPDMVLQIQSYFFEQKTHMNDIIDRKNDTLKRYTNPEKTGFKLNMPVYILTSRFTFSGAEDFSYGMQQAKRAVVVGDTTGGGAHPTNAFSIGQGFVAFVPIARAPVGKDWESIGVWPNISVPSEQALTKAQHTAWSDLLAKTTDGVENLKITWQLNNLKAAENTKLVDEATLNKYTGTYGGRLNFYIKDGSLYGKDAKRGNEAFKLKPVSEDLFVLDENVEVQFEKDAGGIYTHLKMLWSDGYVTEKWKDSFSPLTKETITVPASIFGKYAGIYLFDDKFASILIKDGAYCFYSSGTYCKMYFTTEKDFFNTEFSGEKQFVSNATGQITGYTRKLNNVNLQAAVKIRNVDTLKAPADFFNAIGWHLLENKKYDEAIEYFKRALQLYPNDLALQINLAHSYLFKKEYNKAIEIYKSNLKQPDDLSYTWVDMIKQDFEFFKNSKFPTDQMDKLAGELKLKELLEKSKEEKEKRITQWGLNSKRAETTKIPDVTVLKQYVGVYEGGLDFYIKDGRLFCKNAERGNELFELKYIDNSLFVLDENVQVEFEKDSKDIYSKLKMHWKNGTTDEKRRM